MDERVKDYDYYRERKRTVTARLKSVQELHGRFQETVGSEPSLLQEITEKGFTRELNELTHNLEHIRTKLRWLKRK